MLAFILKKNNGMENAAKEGNNIKRRPNLKMQNKD